uniref:Carbonic anhydrase n=1 Tax=Garnotia stricta var. longiseta TaxID=2358306 RepID=A0A3B8DUZ6_9POAL|nr:beta-carbonic anhydrase 2P2 [Garnotia stricta var. longiseta]
MGGCCSCFLAGKPKRENPMHPSREPITRSGSSAAGYHHPPPMVTYSEGLGAANRLKVGFRTFKKNIYDPNPMLFDQLKSGQSPKYMVFACSDSRVCPSVTLDLKPGEAFTVRNIASLVPAYQQNVMHSSIGSAIEFAVTILKVECIVVIAHSCCGGIKELLTLKEDRPRTNHFIDDWVKIGLDIKKKVERVYAFLSFDEQCTKLEIEAVNLSLRNLKTYPFVMDRLAKGTLVLIGARYDFLCGSFQTWNEF